MDARRPRPARPEYVLSLVALIVYLPMIVTIYSSDQVDAKSLNDITDQIPSPSQAAHLRGRQSGLVLQSPSGAEYVIGTEENGAHGLGLIPSESTSISDAEDGDADEEETMKPTRLYHAVMPNRYALATNGREQALSSTNARLVNVNTRNTVSASPLNMESLDQDDDDGSDEDESGDGEPEGGSQNPRRLVQPSASPPLLGSASALNSDKQTHPVAGDQSADDSEEADQGDSVDPSQAAEAEEADAANKSALDEQQQQQQQLIMAQAQSDAKAIRDQQEALLRQATLQQEMLAKRRHFEMNRFATNISHPIRLRPRSRAKISKLTASSNVVTSERPGLESASDSDSDSLGEPMEFILEASEKVASQMNPSLMNTGQHPIQVAELAPAEQHHYGPQYHSLKKHHAKYYQYAGSHKKGQYDAGFKRGNKKFSISGHSSQHKSHAEGHMKWKSKKGKGMHHWDYKHKDKHHHHHHHY